MKQKTEAKILVVTNDSEMGMRLISILKSRNYEAELCTNLSEISQKISERLPDLIFWLFHSNIPEDLPGIMLQIRQTYNDRLLSFFAYPRGLFQPGFENLADEFVVSPFHVSNTLNAIENLLQKKLRSK